jgi:hypothetical protein
VDKFVQYNESNASSLLSCSHGLNEITGFQLQNRSRQTRSRIRHLVSRLDRHILPLIAALSLSVSAFSQTPRGPAGPYPASVQTMQFPAKQDKSPEDPQLNLIKDRMSAGQVFHPSNMNDPRRVYFLYQKFVGSAEWVFRVEDREIPVSGGSIAIGLYAPNVHTDLPPWVSFHGGNAADRLNTYDVTLPALTSRWNCPVVQVGCRLAPENRYIAASNNAYATMKWVAVHPVEIGQYPRTPLSATPLGTFGLPAIPGTPQTPTSEANRSGNIDLTMLAAHFRERLRFRRQN